MHKFFNRPWTAIKLQGFLLPILLLLFWEYLSHQGDAYAYAFVPVSAMWSSLFELLHSGELHINLLATLKSSLAGLLIGGSLGLIVGGLMGVSVTANRIIGPIYHSVRQVPLLGWIPLIGLWFGNGLFAKLLIVSLAAFYPMVLNTFEGIRNVANQYVEVAQVLKFSRWQLFRHVLLPGALPSIITGVQHAMAFAWISTVGSELLFATGAGLGGLMLNAQEASRMDIVILCVASIGITGLAMNSVFARFSRYLLRWRSVR